MKKLVILCAGDFGKEVTWLIEDINKQKPTYEILGFLDDDERKVGMKLNGYECLGTTKCLIDLHNQYNACAVIATQDGDVRKKLVNTFSDFNDWETLIHPTANISDTSFIGRGSIICAGVSISVNTRIGDFCMFNIGIIMGHDCIIDDYVSIMSGVCVTGHVQIKEGAYIATNSTIIPGMKIGTHARVGAGSVVLRNVRSDTLVMGVPAKVMKF